MEHFRFGTVIDAGFEVVAIGFVAGEGVGQVGFPVMVVVGDAGFGVEEVVFLVDEDGGVIIEAIDLVIDMPVLEVGKSGPMCTQLLLPLGIDIKIRLMGGLIIILVVIGEAAILRPYDVPIVSAVKAVPAAAEGELGIVLFVLQGEDASEEIVVQPSLADEAGAL